YFSFSVLINLQKNSTFLFFFCQDGFKYLIGAPFGLRKFTQIRYDAQKLKRKMDPALAAKVNMQRQSVILEEEYEKLKELNLRVQF
uniref:Cytochrome c oxidase assembly protein COX16 homolog, mitochondrial n=1 Tax=Acanthochromis polyacanthus TaxID=80966 RepID=A0A3Q1GFD5_9TELE